MMPWGGVFCMQIEHYIRLKMLYKEKMKTEISFFFLFHSPFKHSDPLVPANIHGALVSYVHLYHLKLMAIIQKR